MIPPTAYPPADHPRVATPPLSVADLINVRYREFGLCAREGLDCWGLARLVLARLDVHLPRDPADALAREPELFDPVEGVARAGDVVVLQGGNPRLHLAVAVNAFQVIHATREGVRLDRLDAWRRAGKVLRVLRPRELGGAA